MLVFTGSGVLEYMTQCKTGKQGMRSEANLNVVIRIYSNKAIRILILGIHDMSINGQHNRFAFGSLHTGINTSINTGSDYNHTT